MLMKKLGIKTVLPTIRTVYTELLVSTGLPVRISALYMVILKVAEKIP